MCGVILWNVGHVIPFRGTCYGHLIEYFRPIMCVWIYVDSINACLHC